MIGGQKWKYWGELMSICHCLPRLLHLQYLWNEMIRQTIREATTLVVIVSHNSFHTSRWYELPRIISTESSVRVAAVVLTMRDTGTITTREVTERKKLVRSVFWPDATNAGLVFSCSSTVGPVLEEIDDFLGKSSVPPPWEYYWESSRRRVCKGISQRHVLICILGISRIVWRSNFRSL